MSGYQKGDEVLSGWEIVRPIGEGAFGKVYEVQKAGRGVVARSALKVVAIPPSQSMVDEALSQGMDEASVAAYFGSIVDDFMNEVELLSSIPHPGVVGYQDHAVLPHGDGMGWDVLLRMELLEPLTARLKAGSLPQAEAARLGAEVADALAFCHGRGVIHRDVKPGNVFVDGAGRHKLGDFGVSRTADQTMGAFSRKGTEDYMAPEVFRGEPYGAPADVYSLGITLYQLLNGNRLPFLPPAPAPVSFPDRQRARERRLSGEALPPIEGCNPELFEAVRAACDPDPSLRPSAARLRDLLENLELPEGQPQPSSGGREPDSEGEARTLLGPNPSHTRVLRNEPGETARAGSTPEAAHTRVLWPAFADAGKEAAEQEARKRAEDEARERAEQERLERERREKEEREREDRARREQAERERKEKAERERLEREEQERLERERRAREEKAERERAEREEAARLERERAERENRAREEQKRLEREEVEDGEEEKEPPAITRRQAIIVAGAGTLAVIGLVVGLRNFWEKQDPGGGQGGASTTAGDSTTAGAAATEVKLVAVSAGGHHTVGLRSDGTAVAAGLNNYGQCDVSGWTGLAAVSAGLSHTVGVRSDGTAVATGSNDHGQCDVSGWTGLVAASAGSEHTVGVRSDGTAVATGRNDHGQCDVSGWTGLVAVSAGSEHTVGLRSDGTAVAVGSNVCMQCDVSGWTGLSAVAAGSSYTVSLRSDGTAVAAGYEGSGECDVSGWTGLVDVSAGGFHTVGLRSDGTAVATGKNDYGQCDVSGWTDLVAVSVGFNHTVGLRSDGAAVATGYNEDSQCDVSSW